MLKEYVNQDSNEGWIKFQDYQIETKTFIFRKDTLTRTLTGFPIELITITGHSTSHHPIQNRKIIFITARVHAAEVAGSYKMEGILKFLCGNSKPAELLRSI